MSTSINSYVRHLETEYDQMTGAYDREESITSSGFESVSGYDLDAIGSLFAAYPEFKKDVAELLRPDVARELDTAIKRMPRNTYWTKDDNGRWKNNKLSRYTAQYKKENNAEWESHKKLKYHYTENKHSIRKQTHIYVNMPTKGIHKNDITIRWRVSKRTYNYLKYGYDSKGRKSQRPTPDWITDYEASPENFARRMLNARTYDGMYKWDSFGRIVQDLMLKYKYWELMTPEMRKNSKNRALHGGAAPSRQEIINISAPFNYLDVKEGGRVVDKGGGSWVIKYN